MQRKTLDLLARARRQASVEAEQSVARCARAEAQALEDLRQAERAIDRERDAVAGLPFGDGSAEAFAAWLPQARRAVEQARDTHAQTASATAQARQELKTALIALEVVKSLIARKKEEEKQEEKKRARLELEEMITMSFHR